jgi:hypothetical protein
MGIIPLNRDMLASSTVTWVLCSSASKASMVGNPLRVRPAEGVCSRLSWAQYIFLSVALKRIKLSQGAICSISWDLLSWYEKYLIFFFSGTEG